MGVADRLISEVFQIAEQFKRSATSLEREILDLEREILDLQTKLQQKKVALHAASMASKRAGDFVPMLGPDFYCPACWIEKEERATLFPIPGNTMKCNVCDRGFAV